MEIILSEESNLDSDNNTTAATRGSTDSRAVYSTCSFSRVVHLLQQLYDLFSFVFTQAINLNCCQSTTRLFLLQVCVALLQIRVTGGATKHCQATRCTGNSVFPTMCPTVSFTLLHKSISATYTSYYQKLTTSIEQNALMAVNRPQDTQPHPTGFLPSHDTQNVARQSSSLVPAVRQLNHNKDVSSYFFRTNLILSSNVLMLPRGLAYIIQGFRPILYVFLMSPSSCLARLLVSVSRNLHLTAVQCMLDLQQIQNMALFHSVIKNSSRKQ